MKPLYGYFWKENGPDTYRVYTESWEASIDATDPRIMSRYSYVPGRGLLWTHVDLKEEEYGPDGDGPAHGADRLS